MSTDESGDTTSPALSLHLALPPALLRAAVGGPGLIVVAGAPALCAAAVEALAEHRRRVGPADRAVLIGTISDGTGFDTVLAHTLQSLCLCAVDAADAEALFALVLRSPSALALAARVRALVVVRNGADGPTVELLGPDELARRLAERNRLGPPGVVAPSARGPENERTGIVVVRPPAAPLQRPTESVQFRAYAPAGIAPGAAALVDIWACLPSQADAVARLAAGSVAEGLRSGVGLARGAVITVRLRIEGLHVKPASQPLVWAGEPANVGFVAAAPAAAAEGRHRAHARLAVEGMVVGDLHFLVTVAAQRHDLALTDTGATHSNCRSAFASYASQDRSQVLARVQGMKAVAPDLDIFLDALSLRSGDRWEQRIEREITLRERLFLFWSPSARVSKWVDHEWRLAKRLKGIDAIDPVPLADPRAAPPPRELAALHFGSAYVEMIAGTNAMAQRLP